MKERIPQSPPQILPASDNPDRPLWSVMIPVHNCSEYLSDVLESVLTQDLGPALMQIEVVDDASTDAEVDSLVRSIGQGRVSYFRQAANVGNLRNFETCIQRATGQWIHLLHGDDRVLPGFYLKLGALFQQYPESGAVFSNYRTIDEKGRAMRGQPGLDQEGVLKNWLFRIAELNRIQYCTIAVRRSVYEQLGAFYGVKGTEDWEMWVRIARYYPVAYTPEILAEYRVHGRSMTERKIRDHSYIRDFEESRKLILEHLPVQVRSANEQQACEHFAMMYIGQANLAWDKYGNRELAARHLATAQSKSATARVLYHIMKCRFKMAIGLQSTIN